MGNPEEMTSNTGRGCLAIIKTLAELGMLYLDVSEVQS